MKLLRGAEWKNFQNFVHLLVLNGFIILSASHSVSDAQVFVGPPNYHKNVVDREDALRFLNSSYGHRMLLSSTAAATSSLILHPKDCNGLCVPVSVCLRHGGTAKGFCSKSDGVFCCFARSCNQVSKDLVSYFQSPGYPASAIGTMICQHDIVVRTGICQIRLDFQNFNTTEPLDRGICDIDQFLILNSLDGAAFPRCGELSGYSTIVSVDPNEKVPLTLLSIIQSTKESCKWSIKVTQMKCEKRRILDYPDCGTKYGGQDYEELHNFLDKRIGSRVQNYRSDYHHNYMKKQAEDMSNPYVDNFFYLEYLKQTHDMMMIDGSSAASVMAQNKNQTLCRNSVSDKPKSGTGAAAAEKMTQQMMYHHYLGIKNVTKSAQKWLTTTMERRIIRGEETELFELPWQVSIQQKKRHFCGGAIISEYFVITASHCFVSIAPLALTQIKVVMGDYDLNTKTETHHVEAEIDSVIFHSHFDPYYLRNDIALIRLRKPIHFRPGIQPVCLGKSGDDYVGKTATISGWGATNYPKGKLASTLQKVDNKIITNGECQKLLKIHYLFNSMICAVAPKCAGTCFGDSGGPLVHEKGAVSRLVGIVSFGIGGCALLPYWPDVYTRVTEYLDWISYATRWV